MDLANQKWSFLIATDFDLAVFSEVGFQPEIKYGGWVVDRIPYQPDEMIRDINDQEIDVLVVEEDRVPGVVFENCPDLKIVISMRSNPVNVDLEAAKKYGKAVLYAPGRNAQAVAELTLCFMLDLLRMTSAAYLDLRKGNWGTGKEDPYLRFRGRELQGRTVGLVGFGAIGQALARLLSGFSVRLLAHDPFQSQQVFEEYGVIPLGLDEVMGQAEIISIHTPLNEHTRSLIAARELSLVRPGTLLINTARAEIVNQQALIDALEDNVLAGAALDVHYQEPPAPNDPLYDVKNLLYTPHIGGATYEVITRGSRMVIADLLSYLRGEAPRWAAALPDKPRSNKGA